jgi:hypothetical protein
MALDLYVGSLTRYYAHNWETAGQKWAREQGISHQTVRPTGAATEAEVVDTRQIQSAAIQWRSSLTQALGSNLVTPLDWDERPEAPYFTDRPAWDGYACLVLLAAYEEHPEFQRPKESTQDWSKDPAWLASTTKEFRTRYPSLLESEIWLPCDFGFTFKCQDLAGRDVVVGSSIPLLNELHELNGRTFQGKPDNLKEWRFEGAEFNGPFDKAAQFGLTLFLELTENSVEHHLPMKLDY